MSSLICGSCSQSAHTSARVPSAGACHDTMRTLSQAILEQLASPIASSAPQSETASAAATLRNLSRTAPMSSSRDEPLPNSDYLAPLPSVTLPYELSLLDNLFVNPMATHQKASDYTNGAKTRAAEVRSSMGIYGQNGNGNPGVSTANLSNGGGGGRYGLADQVRAGYTDCPTIEQSLAGSDQRSRSVDQIQGSAGDSNDYGPLGNGSTGQQMDTMGDLGMILGAMDGQEGSVAGATGMTGTGIGSGGGLQSSTLTGLGDNAQTFDFFSFLEEGFVQDAGLDGMALWS